MKLILPVLPAVILADHGETPGLQNTINARVEAYQRRINWITERRLVPELVSHEEFEGQEEEINDFAGKYRMERPHVNFWLDFSNQRLLQFRQQSNKYQTAKNMLSTSDRAYGAKKYGVMVDQEWDERNQHYNFYRTHNDERFTRPTKNNLLRRMASLENMIQYAQKNTLSKKPFGAYFDYGCYCFPGSFVDPKHSPHAEPRDAIDSVCREHSWAYDCAKADFGHDCRGKYQEYKWEGTINEDGFSPEINCLDDKDTCSWAICEADKYLAERLNNLAGDYTINNQVPLPGEYRPQAFDRFNTCYKTHMVEGTRDELEHNNDSIHNLTNGDDAEDNNEGVPATQGVASPSNSDSGSNMLPGAGLMGDYVTMHEEPLPDTDAASPGGENNIGRQWTPNNNNNAGPVNYNNAGGNKQTPVEFIPDLHGPMVDSMDWGSMSFEYRSQWADKGWPVPEIYTQTQSGPGGNFNPSGNFPDYGSLPQIDNSDPNSPVPGYTHDTDVTPDNEDELAQALDTVNSAVPVDDIAPVDSNNNPLVGDDASTFGDDSPATPNTDDSYLDASEGTRSAGSPMEQSSNTTPNDTEDLPDVVLKSAITYSVKKCCGTYPRRYKFSAGKRGCCIHNGVERLYSPHHSQCCQIRAQGARGVYQPYESFLAHKNDNCLQLLANNERHEYQPSFGPDYNLPN